MSNDSPQPTRTPSQIEADLGATRDRLAASVEALIDQVHPNRIKQRQIANVKHFANTELEAPNLRSSMPVAIFARFRIAVIAPPWQALSDSADHPRHSARRGSSD